MIIHIEKKKFRTETNRRIFNSKNLSNQSYISMRENRDAVTMV